MSNGAASEESIPAHPAPPRPPRLDVLVVGNAGCGKSALISRFAGGQHRHGRAPAVGPPAEPPQRGGTDQPSLFSVRLGGRHFELAFTESSDAQSLAQSQWSRRRLASGPNVVVIAYDISDRSSLDGTREWRKEIGYQLEAGIPEADQHATPLDGQTATQTAAAASLPPAGLHLQIMLLGLKRDLRREEPGVIHPQEGHRVAQELHCDAYAECSAVTGELVGEVFEDIARLAVLSRTGKGSEQGGCMIL